jgi:hypothetical protein
MRKVVTWKCETPTAGQITIYHDYDNAPTMWEWGTTPAGVEKVPAWTTRAEAVKLADKLKAEFMEF